MSDVTDSGGNRISGQRVYEEISEMKKDLAEMNTLLREHIALESAAHSVIEKDVADLRVGHTELRADQAAIAAKVSDHDVDIKILKNSAAQAQSRRAPWWTWPAAILATLGVGGWVIDAVNAINHPNLP